MQANKNKKKHFESFADYLKQIEKMVYEAPKAEKIILETVGREVEKNAKDKFGHYQEAFGKFDKWPELADSTQQDRLRKGYTPNDPLLRDGTLKESISHTVHGNTVTIGSDSPVMVYQELGTKNIPPRPVLGPALYEKRARIKVLCSEVMFALLTNQLNSVK